uniref:Uncharacterized protein n=1 Tax=Brassica oleracea TaxID=3712 RepID=A0A3P6C641_BRAOL|nr:unnamed protein product [Brassica oleracea]
MLISRKLRSIVAIFRGMEADLTILIYLKYQETILHLVRFQSVKNAFGR